MRAREDSIATTGPKEALVDVRALSKAGATLTALLEHLQRDRVLVEGSTQHSGVTFARVGDTVIRVSSEVEKSPLVFNWAQNVLRCTPDRVSVNIAPATLAELLDCQRELEKNGSGEARVRVAEFIAFMRQESKQQPLEIRVVNASELHPPDKVMMVKRDDEGKMAAVVVQSLT
jgi:hypothetical protein